MPWLRIYTLNVDDLAEKIGGDLRSPSRPMTSISATTGSRVAELTPRLWKLHFAANPLRSALHTLVA
jgi:hypothetical protein